MRCHRLVAVIVILSTTAAAAEKPGSEPLFASPSEETQLSELQRLRGELDLAHAEIGRLQSLGSVQQAAWQQGEMGSDAGMGGSGGGGAGGGGDLASKSQNPISDLVSVPIQNNFNVGFDPGYRTQYVGNLQPVVPVKLNEDWNLIQRMIVPFVNSPIGREFRSDGIGDSLIQLFFSPRNSEGIIWGVGPNILCPTASDPTLGFQEWGLGVNGVVLAIEGPIVAGMLVSQVWSLEGNTKPFLAQPFFNYNLPRGWFLSASADCNADWELPENRRWTIPLGAGIGRVFPLFGQPLNVNTRFGPFVEGPPGGPDWEYRVQITYLFPK